LGVKHLYTADAARPAVCETQPWLGFSRPK
jgi:hypothetical protein